MDLRDQVRRKVNTARTMLFGPMASRRDDGPDDFTEMRTRMERVGTVLRDPKQTAFRVVTIPKRWLSARRSCWSRSSASSTCR